MATKQTDRITGTSSTTLVAQPGLISTSTTSLTIGTGAQTLTIGTGLQFQAGQQVLVASSANAGNYMQGSVTSYNSTSGALVISVPSGATGGSGTFASWNVSVCGVQGVTPWTSTTSASSVAIGTGAKTFTVATALSITAGTFVTVSDQANSANYMHGTVTSYNSTTGALVVNVTDVGGSGTKAAWNINLSGTQGPTGATGATGPTGSLAWAVAGGTADAITATYSPTNTSLTDGLTLSFRATAANATTTPTFNPDGLGAKTITKYGGRALVAGNIAGNLTEYIVRYNLANTRWELLNPTLQYQRKDFTSSGTFTPTAPVPHRFRAQAPGGGSGGNSANGGTASGGGGAGQLIDDAQTPVPGNVLTITLGAQGTAGTNAPGNGGNGGDTTISGTGLTTITAKGGSGSAAANSVAGTGGAGGTGSTGSANARAYPAADGCTAANSGGLSNEKGGDGAASAYGGGGTGQVGVGGAGKAFGAGAGGSGYNGGANAGALGGPSYVSIEWWE